MLTEITDVRQIKGETPRRWFRDKDWDLIVWIGESDDIMGFQLCYKKKHGEHALTWRKDQGFVHQKVDDGESYPMQYKETPILVPDGSFNITEIAEKFGKISGHIDDDVVEFVYLTLLLYPNWETTAE
ncbi:MAG: hypothetical protein BMS9Abin26_0829 [Gammaproteobacteria bacterium]|nr:MAG: hypothetical protein BMS9Abin26_0829 [Gammaproteobacteria bacterium]